MSYFDSAYIAKFYVDESDSAAVRRLAESLGRVHCCAFGRVEVASVFRRKWREGAFSEQAFRAVSAQFADDCSGGLWTWLPLTESLLARTTESLLALPKKVTLCSADALHLVCAREHGLRLLFTNDKQMLLAAPAFGIEAKGV